MSITPLDSFFTDFITEAIKPIPDDAPSKKYFMKINNKKIPYYFSPINKRRGMFYENIAFMMETNKGRIQKRFDVLSKKLRLDKKRFYLMEHQHYDFIRSDLKSELKLYRGKPTPFIYFEGITVFVGFMRGEVRDEVYLEWNSNLHKKIREQQKLKYQTTSVHKLIPFPGSYYSKDGKDCKSKMEQIVVNLFYDLGIDIGVKQVFHRHELSYKSQRLMEKHGLWFLDYDFFCQTKPLTLIDVQGVEGKISYKVKKDVARIEGFSLFIVKNNEDRNIPQLRQRIIDIFIKNKGGLKEND